ncbi:MAG: serine--tRNA ligase, partial [Bacteroidales bacterium]|nr:serine--tRNA ligase [Bacteroidales bacterium]
MLTLKYLSENKEEAIKKLAKKHFDAAELIDQILELDVHRRNTQQQADACAAELNSLSKSIGMLMKEGKKDEAAAAKAKTAELKENSKMLEAEKKAAEDKIQELLVLIPNLPHDSVPEGRHAEDNLVERTGGVVPELSENALPHWDLAKKYDLIDFELGAKITGAGFPVYKGKMARLQRALISFFLDSARDNG